LSRVDLSFDKLQRRAWLAQALIARVREFRATFALWRNRVRTRRALAQLGERELADIGVCWSQIAEEVNKPFWRE
jgi:uncharacterized protein YjiS (DUF1127 family)